jgi:hypothetical protein
VPRDRSLEEFLDGITSDEDESETSGDTGSEASDASGDASDAGPADPEAATSGPESDSEGPEPLAPTYRWSADGGACSNCGDPARARWHGDDGFVCRRCKEW